ncbi:MAG: C40 family peptidase [Polynucleobacter sp.]|jgi:cell wall-associated NlpC family hydrolase|nr:C40 family peptidase [Polynucleobacter sp.]
MLQTLYRKRFRQSILAFGFCLGSTLLLSACSSFSSRQSSTNTGNFNPSGSARIAQFQNDTSAGNEDISIAAIGLVDVPYRWGGNTPNGGFDCSGLIVYVYKKTTGIQLPRTIQEMSRSGKAIGQQAPAPGDLVFFNTSGEQYSHAGIYVGKGRFVHAPSSGGTVRLERIDSPYWAARYTEARRIKNN